MYQSPINIYKTAAQTIMEHRENAIYAKIQDAFYVQVDKTELLRALQYDRNQYDAGYRDGKADATPRWIPVTERLPESGVHVLVCCEVGFGSGRYVCDGYFADRYTEKAWDHGEDVACEYCEDDDEHYLWRGWYEVIKNWDDYNSIVIGDTVTHWMPLPEPPKP